MANNYRQYSESIENLSQEEADWLRKLFDAASNEEDPARWTSAQAMAKYEGVWDVDDIDDDDLSEFGKIIKEGASDGDPTPCVRLDIEEEGDKIAAWIYAEEHGDVETIGNFIQAFFKKFNKKDAWFSLTWADTCSKLRIGEFGGGAMLVTHDMVLVESTYTMVESMKVRAGVME